MRSVPENPDIKVVKLPFYDVHAELLRPVSLIPQGANRFQEAQYSFYLSSSQATDIASNRDIQIGAKLDYLYQVRILSWDLDLLVVVKLLLKFRLQLSLSLILRVTFIDTIQWKHFTTHNQIRWVA